MRVSEHKRAVRNMSSTPEIAKHVMDLDHRMDWEAAQMLDREVNYFKRTFKEAWHSKASNSVNILRNRVCQMVDDAWASLF